MLRVPAMATDERTTGTRAASGRKGAAKRDSTGARLPTNAEVNQARETPSERALVAQR